MVVLLMGPKVLVHLAGEKSKEVHDLPEISTNSLLPCTLTLEWYAVGMQLLCINCWKHAALNAVTGVKKELADPQQLCYPVGHFDGKTVQSNEARGVAGRTHRNAAVYRQHYVY